MTLPTIQLIERRVKEVRLPRSEAAFLRDHARSVLEIVPGFGGGRYRLTPRGQIGFFDGPKLRYEIEPKFSWNQLLWLMGLEARYPSGDAPNATGGLLIALARTFLDQLRSVLTTGLILDYEEANQTDSYLRGRLRTIDQMKETLTRPVPDRFHISASQLAIDTPWNRILGASVSQLLDNFDLPLTLREELRIAASPLDWSGLGPLRDDDFALANLEPRIAHYRDALQLCQLIQEGFRAGQFSDTARPAFLFDLGQAFERYLIKGLQHAFHTRSGWVIQGQPEYVLGMVRDRALILQPDVVLRFAGEVRAVLDVKWKRPDPDAADLHQILAYGLMTRAQTLVLAYPGSRFTQQRLRIADSGLALWLVRVPVGGTREECQAGLTRLADLLGAGQKA